MKKGLNDFFDGIRMALDPLVTFGVKQVPEKVEETSNKGCKWSDFKGLTTQLIQRELTGYAARDAIKSVMNSATKEQWNGFYRRVLIKDLRCGVSEKTINKVAKKFPQYAIPIFSCPLAHDSANHEKKMIGKKQIEIKLDGVRVLTIIRNNKVEMFSRNGKQFHNFGHIIAEIEKVLEKHPDPQDLVLDGEVMSANFQDLMKQVHRKDGKESKDAVLHLFDICPLKNFKEGLWKKPQTTRSMLVKDWVTKNSTFLKHVQTLDWEDVDLDTTKGQMRFIELNKEAVEGGYEGVMIKNPNAWYECKRTHSWLKAKPFIEVTLRVVAIEEGTGRNEGRLGAILVEGEDDKYNYRLNCGSGFSDSQREEYWSERDQIIGQLVEIRADARTKSQDAETFSLRFPRFKCFRGFEPGQKI
ncbi:ATP-dependent DNA ligase [Prochlorococcus marinus str. MIT 9515]|uniref:ATP-dependent DNA ligase n=2 Tax=Prochlorococcus marinus TaxID=1219 RepID=A2BZ66_PROM5|nr:ATP-dependent DNA ligase [Prochlorococcus marinus str. MIT 9515]